MEKKLFTYEADGQALIIHLPEELDHHNCLTLKYETDLLLAENYINRIVFDFSKTEFMDSSGIGVLLNRYKQIYGVKPRINRILKIGGIKQLVRQYRNKEEAVHGQE